MKDRFEQFVSGITLCYKQIQKIKTMEMTELGLKGNHVMCIFYLSRHPEGLSPTQLVSLCQEDKAAVSRTLAELTEGGYVECGDTGRRYRAPMVLSEKGWEVGRRVGELLTGWVEAGGRGLSEEERSIFYHALELISHNLRDGYSDKSL